MREQFPNLKLPKNGGFRCPYCGGIIRAHANYGETSGELIRYRWCVDCHARIRTVEKIDFFSVLEPGKS